MSANRMHPVPPVDVDREILGKLMKYIRSENLKEGARLPSEREFAARLDVGRNKLRELLSTLETLRVIEMRPQSGMYLRELGVDTSFEILVLLSDLGLPLTRDEVAQSLEVRQFLEIQAITMASQRRTNEDLDRLADVIERQIARTAENVSCFHEDQEFHLGIVQATKNDVFVRIINSFFLMTMSRREKYFSDKDRALESIRQHKNILAAIQSGDPASCADLMTRHMQDALDFYLVKINETPTD